MKPTKKITLRGYKGYKTLWMARTQKLIVPVVLVLLAIGLSFLLPTSRLEVVSPQIGILALVITKTIFISCGFAFGYLIKEKVWPYLSLQELLIKQCWSGVLFLIAWYVGCIYCFSLGG